MVEQLTVQEQKFIQETKDSTKTSRLIPFIFNDDQTYALEFGDQYMRVYKNGAAVTVGTLTAWADATAYVIGDLRSNGGTNYYCIQSHTSNAANDEPGSGSNWTDFWHALTGSIFEIPTPFLEADLSTIQYKQSADVVTLDHPSYDTREIVKNI